MARISFQALADSQPEAGLGSSYNNITASGVQILKIVQILGSLRLENDAIRGHQSSPRPLIS